VSILEGAGLVVAALLVGYLIAALVLPERF
jgi:K+-transporting ATPase KdpF subunit